METRRTKASIMIYYNLENTLLTTCYNHFYEFEPIAVILNLSITKSELEHTMLMVKQVWSRIDKNSKGNNWFSPI